MKTVTEDGHNSFKIGAPGPFHVRDYSKETLAELAPVYALVDALMERHKLMVPGSMAHLVRAWRTGLWHAIEAKGTTPVVSAQSRPAAEIEAAAEAAETLLRHRDMLPSHLATLLVTFRADLTELVEDDEETDATDDGDPRDHQVEIGVDRQDQPA